MIAYDSVKSEPRVLSAAVMLQGRQHAQCRAHMWYVPGCSGPAGVVQYSSGGSAGNTPASLLMHVVINLDYNRP